MKILIGGDISFGRVHRGECISYSVEGCLDDLALIPRDYSIVNLESPICSTPLSGEKFDNYDSTLLYAHPNDVRHLKKAKIDFVSLGNNHALDHGVKGVEETVSCLDKASISHCGTRESHFVDHSRKLIIFSIDLIEDYKANSPVMCSRNVAQLFEGTLNLRRAYSDHLIVICCHWGEDFYLFPTTLQTRLARRLVDLGADMIVGCHPHVKQPVEMYKGKPIFYSMGNLYFTHHRKMYDNLAEVHQSFISVVDFDGREYIGRKDYKGFIQSGISVDF
tara:strand:+ start:12858 stop:13688 length:831 start_codon:yes stop_codon:yes gene_type:complete